MPFDTRRVIDIQTHTDRWEFIRNPLKEADSEGALFIPAIREAGRIQLAAWDSALLRGREVHRLSFGFPWLACDFEAANRFAAEQARQYPMGGALILVHPSMSAEKVEEQITTQGFLGLKPYRLYAQSGGSCLRVAASNQCKARPTIGANSSRSNSSHVGDGFA